MCMSRPSTPAAPTAVQEVKQPETAALTDKAKKNRASSAVGGGSLLTGPSGVATAMTGKTTLLGG